MSAELTANATDRAELTARVLVLLPVTVACGQFMTSLDQNVVITALPAIGASLGEAPSQLGLVITAYVASLVISMPLGGWAAERFGARKSYCAALLVFAISSALCGLSTELWMLVASRILQGFGGALMGTLGQVVLLQSLPRDRTLKINMYVSLAGQSGPMVGPVVGGALTTYVSWHWIFFINIPLALAAAAAAAFLFPATPNGKRTPFDSKGFVLVSTGMVLLVFGMDLLAGHNWPTWLTIVELALALAVLTVASFYCLRAPNPLLDLRLLRIRTFRASFLTGGGFDTVGMSSVLFLLPLMFQVGFGMNAMEAGSLTFMAAVGSVLMRFFMPTILKRYGFRRVLVTNTPVAAALVAGFAFLQADTPTWIVLAYIFVFGVVRSMQWASTGNLSYSDIEPDQLAGFSALYFILWQLGVAVSVGTASAMVSLLAGSADRATANDFRIVFIVEGLITLCGLFAYRGLKPDDGTNLSGHKNLIATE
jgi:EmrB/QacA subfamily drug resistance transporter